MEFKTSPAPVSVSGGGVSAGGKGIISGLASTYGGPPDLVGDIIERGAYAKTLRDWGRRRVALYEHDTKEPIGEAILTDTVDGLAVEMNLDLELPGAVKAYALARRGFGRFSIGYTPTKKRGGGSSTRYLEEIELHEISSVVFPANPRAVATGVKEPDDGWTLEKLLADIRAYNRKRKHEAFMRKLDARNDRLRKLAERAARSPEATRELQKRIRGLEESIRTELRNLAAASRDPKAVRDVPFINSRLDRLRSEVEKLREELDGTTPGSDLEAFNRAREEASRGRAA